MGVEIERKFLVKDDSFKTYASEVSEIRQGYLNREPERVVRIRIRGNRGYLTVKGRNIGASRLEFEYEIPLKDAEEMLSLCVPPILSKSRYIVVGEDGLRWEIDEFHGHREGLVLAEVELNSADQPVILPSFISEEVTGDPRYFNSNLLTN